MLFADAAADPVYALLKLDIETLIFPVVVQLCVILLVARLAGVVFRWIGQPSVVGEILAGVMMGPSVFGWLFPSAFTFVFHPQFAGIPAELTAAAIPKIFQVLAQLGLLFLLFLIGLEFDYSHLRVKGKAAVAICIVGTVLPFLLGAGIAPWIHPYLEPYPLNGPVPLFGMALFMGTALSITALPILGQILIELGITRTKLAVVVIAASAVGDAVGWVLLATVATLAKVGTDGYDPWHAVRMVVLLLGFAAVMVLVVRPLLARYFRWVIRENGGELGLNGLSVLMVAMLLASLATNLIGIFAVFGAFALGAVLSDQTAFRDAAVGRIRDFVTAFFLPIFFTYTGLRTEIGSLDSAMLWLICGVVVFLAVAGKIVGCGLAAWLTGFSARESTIVGVMMNTRGLMELIIINVGYDLGVIPKSLFCMFVIVAILTTVMTTPIVLWLRRGTELEDPITASGYLRSTGQPQDDRAMQPA
ncbi:MAG: cation:proton antiporter [Bacteroidales bacterium]|nr:cation:proton antiporter [Bacteroidales bacterium]